MTRFRQHPLYAATQAAIATRAEAFLDIATSIRHGEGGTEDGAGSNLNTEVPSQTGRDAGRSAVNPTVKADRGPGEPIPVGTGIHGLNGGQSDKREDHPVNETRLNAAQRTAVGIFPGCFVQVFEKQSGKRIDSNIVRYVRKIGTDMEVELRGGEKYSEGKYTFKRLA